MEKKGTTENVCLYPKRRGNISFVLHYYAVQIWIQSIFGFKAIVALRNRHFVAQHIFRLYNNLLFQWMFFCSSITFTSWNLKYTHAHTLAHTRRMLNNFLLFCTLRIYVCVRACERFRCSGFILRICKRDRCNEKDIDSRLCGMKWCESSKGELDEKTTAAATAATATYT